MIRLYRLLPLVVVLVIVALAVYLIMTFRYSSDKAKAVLIRVFFWIFTVLSAVFLLITLYALLERNEPVIELFGSCLALTVIGLVVTLICRAIFRRNHPYYGEEVSEATIINESLGGRFADAFKKAFGEALKDTFGPRRKK